MNEMWIVMEYAESGDLHKFLSSSTSPLPLFQQVSLCLQACKAVNYLHSAPSPILHRDLKSLNFLLQHNFKLILTDFGLSKPLQLASAATSPGTLAWAAPELLRGNRKWDEKSDIYGLGMVMYEIVARKIPFQGLNYLEILENLQNKIRPELPSLCSHV